MKVVIKLNCEDLKMLALKAMQEKLGDAALLNLGQLTIETRSTQNYKSEWEQADFRATYEGEV